MGIGIGMLYSVVMLLAGRIGWRAFLTGLVPGTVMLLYSRFSQEKLGWADGLMVISAGLLQQWEKCTAEVLIACFFTFLAAVALLLTGKGTKSSKIPFAPFFLAAVLVLWIWEGCGAGGCG